MLGSIRSLASRTDGSNEQTSMLCTDESSAFVGVVVVTAEVSAASWLVASLSPTCRYDGVKISRYSMTRICAGAPKATEPTTMLLMSYSDARRCCCFLF